MIEPALEKEIERLLQKADVYGPQTVWKQNEFSEILPYPKPLSLSLLRCLASYDGATGIACRDLKTFYSREIPIEDYIETVFGRTYINAEAEKRITTRNAKRSLIREISSSARIRTENAVFYREFDDIRILLEDYFASEQVTDIKKLSDKQLFTRINELILNLNQHYSFIVKAGILAQYNLSTITSLLDNQEVAGAIAADISPLTKKDRYSQSLFEYREQILDELGDYSADMEYELSCPRFIETGKKNFTITMVRQRNAADISLKSKLKSILKYFKIYECFKVILKTLLLRELYLLRKTLIETGRRSGYDEDIFYITLDEILELNGKDLRDVVALRKELHKSYEDIEMPTILTPHELTRFVNGSYKVREHELKGISVNGIELEGTALIYISERDLERSNHKSIIIAKYASPNLVAAFARSRGIITETGGLLSHLAIVAREQGFPLVLQAQDATMLIKEGQNLAIDRHGKIKLQKNTSS